MQFHWIPLIPTSDKVVVKSGKKKLIPTKGIVTTSGIGRIIVGITLAGKKEVIDKFFKNHYSINRNKRG